MQTAKTRLDRDLRGAFGHDPTLSGDGREVNLRHVSWRDEHQGKRLTLELLALRMQLMRNLNCSSLLAEGILSSCQRGSELWDVALTGGVENYQVWLKLKVDS